MTLYFQRGAIDADHLPFVLRMLPFDISFADEDDVLRYWSGRTYRTCDPHFIGQDLRACHPAASLETLEAILQAFRSGEHDICLLYTSSRRRAPRGRVRLPLRHQHRSNYRRGWSR